MTLGIVLVKRVLTIRSVCKLKIIPMPNKFDDIKKVISPAGAEVNSNYLKLGDKFVKTFFILSYPRYLSTGWFEPLINLPHIFDISIFINPVDTNDALKNLRDRKS